MKGTSKKTKVAVEMEYKDALVKKALGYDATEIVEEYVSGDEGDVKLTKKKVTKKNVPPDITALKILMDGCERSVSEMSDEELEQEMNRLIDLLKTSKKVKKERKIEG